jgi:hypothetical protein
MKKKRRADNSGRALGRGVVTRLQIAERALNEPRNLTSTAATPQKNIKNQHKNTKKGTTKN